MNTRVFCKPRFLAFVLFPVLMLSFLWCIVDNILDSGRIAQADYTWEPALAGFLWLAGHGIHGAVAIALPAYLLQIPRNDDAIPGGGASMATDSHY